MYFRICLSQIFPRSQARLPHNLKKVSSLQPFYKHSIHSAAEIKSFSVSRRASAASFGLQNPSMSMSLVCSGSHSSHSMPKSHQDVQYFQPPFKFFPSSCPQIIRSSHIPSKLSVKIKKNIQTIPPASPQTGIHEMKPSAYLYESVPYSSLLPDSSPAFSALPASFAKISEIPGLDSIHASAFAHHQAPHPRFHPYSLSQQRSQAGIMPHRRG